MSYFDRLYVLNKVVKNIEISKYIFLKAYAGDAVSIYKNNEWWILEHSEIYPLKNGIEAWKLFSRENFVYGLNCLRLHNVPFGDNFDFLVKDVNFETLMWYHCFYRKLFEKSNVLLWVNDIMILKWLYYSVYSNVSDKIIYFEKAFYAAAGCSDNIEVLKFFLCVVPHVKQHAFLKACLLGHSKNCFWFLKKGCLVTSEAITNVLYSGNLELLKDILIVRPRNVVVQIPSKRQILYHVFINNKSEERPKIFDKIINNVNYLKKMGF